MSRLKILDFGHSEPVESTAALFARLKQQYQDRSVAIELTKSHAVRRLWFVTVRGNECTDTYSREPITEALIEQEIKNDASLSGITSSVVSSQEQ